MMVSKLTGGRGREREVRWDSGCTYLIVTMQLVKETGTIMNPLAKKLVIVEASGDN